MTILRNYDINTNLQGVNGFGAKPANLIYNTHVAATTDTTLTVPQFTGTGQALNTNSQILARFSYEDGATVFVGVNVTTAAPDGSGTFTASGGIINPEAILVKGGDVIHVYALTQKYVAIAFDFVA